MDEVAGKEDTQEHERGVVSGLHLLRLAAKDLADLEACTVTYIHHPSPPSDDEHDEEWRPHSRILPTNLGKHGPRTRVVHVRVFRQEEQCDQKTEEYDDGTHHRCTHGYYFTGRAQRPGESSRSWVRRRRAGATKLGISSLGVQSPPNFAVELGVRCVG